VHRCRQQDAVCRSRHRDIGRWATASTSSAASEEGEVNRSWKKGLVLSLHVSPQDMDAVVPSSSVPTLRAPAARIPSAQPLAATSATTPAAQNASAAPTSASSAAMTTDMPALPVVRIVALPMTPPQSAFYVVAHVPIGAGQCARFLVSFVRRSILAAINPRFPLCHSPGSVCGNRWSSHCRTCIVDRTLYHGAAPRPRPRRPACSAAACHCMSVMFRQRVFADASNGKY